MTNIVSMKLNRDIEDLLKDISEHNHSTGLTGVVIISVDTEGSVMGHYFTDDKGAGPLIYAYMDVLKQQFLVNMGLLEDNDNE